MIAEEGINIIRSFFEKLGIQITQLEVILDAPYTYSIHLKTNDSGLLIGHSGSNLLDIKTLLKNMLIHHFDTKDIILYLEVNDYIAKKEDKLFTFIMKKIELVKQGKEVILSQYNAYERKKIHAYIAELNHPEICTKSIGEGENRQLHIYKKSKTLTIDIDGIDI